LTEEPHAYNRSLPTSQLDHLPNEVEFS